MLKRIAHIILSCWLAVILLFGSTSKEFVHLFSGHEDTVHCNNNNEKTGLVLEPKHHHCTFLSFCLTAFVNGACVSFSPAVHFIGYSKPYIAYTPDVINISRAITTLRGPPSV